MTARMLTIYPAVDLRGGRCVRLRQGRADEETLYATDPLAPARQFAADGAAWLHVVDLDGAFSGEPRNLDVLHGLAGIGPRVQFGGGMRSLETLAAAFAAGAARCVIGTRAALDPDFVDEAVARFGAERIAVGLDAKDGRVALRGWVESSGWATLELARRVAEAGVRWLIHTDIATDGMLTGPNLAAQKGLARALPEVSVIASGGVSAHRDAAALAALRADVPNLEGVIVGKALYEGLVNLPGLRNAALGTP